MLKLYEKLKLLQKTVNMLVECYELTQSVLGPLERAHYLADIESQYRRVTSLLWHPSEDHVLVDTLATVNTLRVFLIAVQTTVKTTVSVSTLATPPTPRTTTKELRLGHGPAFYEELTQVVKSIGKNT